MLVWLKFDEFIYRRETIHMPNDIKKKKNAPNFYIN